LATSHNVNNGIESRVCDGQGMKIHITRKPEWMRQLWKPICEWEGNIKVNLEEEESHRRKL